MSLAVYGMYACSCVDMQMWPHMHVAARYLYWVSFLIALHLLSETGSHIQSVCY